MLHGEESTIGSNAGDDILFSRYHAIDTLACVDKLRLKVGSSSFEYIKCMLDTLAVNKGVAFSQRFQTQRVNLQGVSGIINGR